MVVAAKLQIFGSIDPKQRHRVGPKPQNELEALLAARHLPLAGLRRRSSAATRSMWLGHVAMTTRGACELTRQSPPRSPGRAPSSSRSLLPSNVGHGNGHRASPEKQHCQRMKVTNFPKSPKIQKWLRMVCYDLL